MIDREIERQGVIDRYLGGDERRIKPITMDSKSTKKNNQTVSEIFINKALFIIIP